MMIKWAVFVLALGLAGCPSTSRHRMSLDSGATATASEVVYRCPDSSITVVFRTKADYHFTWWSEGLELEITSRRADTTLLDWTSILLTFGDGGRFSPLSAWVKDVAPLGVRVKYVDFDKDWIPVRPRKTTVVGLLFSDDEQYLTEYWELHQFSYGGGAFLAKDSAVVCTLPTIYVHVDPKGNKLVRD